MGCYDDGPRIIHLQSDPITILEHVIAGLYRQQQCLPTIRLFMVGLELRIAISLQLMEKKQTSCIFLGSPK